MDSRLSDKGIVRPGGGLTPQPLGPLAVMVAGQNDVVLLKAALSLNGAKVHSLFMSRLYRSKQGVSLVGPMVGAPYAVMVMETLIAWGVHKIIFMGWCGAICDQVKIGDIILPTGALSDEGTSRHYPLREGVVCDPADDGGEIWPLAHPSDGVLNDLENTLNAQNQNYHKGCVWSTDAIYRETPQKVLRYRQKGALAVEMELSALFRVACYRRVEMGAILVVSDTLGDMKWRPGFREKSFRESRRAACQAVQQLCQIP